MKKKISFDGDLIFENTRHRYYFKDGKVFRFSIFAGSYGIRGSSGGQKKLVVEDSKWEITVELWNKYYCGRNGCSKSLTDVLKPFFVKKC